LYLGWAALSGSLGFPLDDAWIHQTYARNLAETGQLAYLPGQPSAGSTSPAWSYLLSVGYLLGIDFHTWAYLMGALSLAAAAWFAYRLVFHIPALRSRPGLASRSKAALLAGLFCVVEWRLVWAAVSGMETILFTALSLALLAYYFSANELHGTPDGPASLQTERIIVSAVGIGLLGGLLTLTRPEGLVLTGLVVLALFVYPRPTDRAGWRIRILATGVSLVSLGLLLIPYVAFNLRTGGSLFPNTFYAKQAEYQYQLSLLARFWRVTSPNLVGAQVLLLPGFFYAAYWLIRRRAWPALLPLVWLLAFWAAYAIRLPVNYQHGRYTIPSVPLLIVYGLWGTAYLLRPRSPRLAIRVLSRSVPIATALLALLFWLRGAQAFAEDVGVIEGEMVATARWLDENTTSADLIAVHDIGAVGYLTDRPLLDLAGLITPEVIPFLTDADRLTEWMLERGATHVVFFPDFSPAYAQMAVDPRFQQVYCTGYVWAHSSEHENMCVYRLSSGKQP
jgi:hypothetical protein